MVLHICSQLESIHGGTMFPFIHRLFEDQLRSLTNSLHIELMSVHMVSAPVCVIKPRKKLQTSQMYIEWLSPGSTFNSIQSNVHRVLYDGEATQKRDMAHVLLCSPRGYEKRNFKSPSFSELRYEMGRVKARQAKEGQHEKAIGNAMKAYQSGRYESICAAADMVCILRETA